jgi:hypothetical protein
VVSFSLEFNIYITVLLLDICISNNVYISRLSSEIANLHREIYASLSKSKYYMEEEITFINSQSTVKKVYKDMK